MDWHQEVHVRELGSLGIRKREAAEERKKIEQAPDGKKRGWV
jgi:hypothetical protein